MILKLYFQHSVHIIFLLTLSLSFGFSHGDLDERIIKASEEIEMFPDSAQLYYNRGKLYYQHEVYDTALIDLVQCENMEYQDVLLDLLFTQVYFKLDSFNRVIDYADRILSKDSVYVNAYKMKAKAMFELSRFEASALCFEKVITYTIRSFPYNYIDAAESWQSLNNDMGFQKAKDILNLGLENLGALITLNEKLVELCLDYDQPALAVEYQNEILRVLNRKENAYYKRALLYKQLGDFDQAQLDLLEAKRLIHNLPIRTQNTHAMREMLAKINKELAK